LDPSGAAWSPLKAVAVLVVAVALGVYLLSLGDGQRSASPAPTTHSSRPTKSTPPSSTAPPAKTTPTTSPPAAQPSSTVKILVANASQTNGIAAYYSGKLASAGWGTLTPVTATTAEATSTVYFATGHQTDASAVAEALGLPASAVQPLGGRVPVIGITRADIVVVAGDDLAAKVPSGSG
jgi:cytoskeletal protein RodZ